eukprot:12412521-Karenia_brevis.AAC.1
MVRKGHDHYAEGVIIIVLTIMKGDDDHEGVDDDSVGSGSPPPEALKSQRFAIYQNPQNQKNIFMIIIHPSQTIPPHDGHVPSQPSSPFLIIIIKMHYVKGIPA